MDPRRFDELCVWLKSLFKVLPLNEAVARLKAGTLPARAAAITFDDGYADNYRVALPILQRHGLSATFFIATGFLDGGRMWNDTIIETVRASATPTLDLSSLGLGLHGLASIDEKRAAISSLIKQIKYQPDSDRITITNRIARLANVSPPDNLMMTSAEVRAMRRAGMQIGAHTVSHPILAKLPDDQAISEIETSKRFLEELLNEKVGLFAYPNGKLDQDYTARTVEIVGSLGFEAAFSTNWGVSGYTDDLLQVRRFTPWDTSRLRFGLRMFSNLQVP
jgi:peptidoglycan/xylan/chitin deacetylase (PgdA/CDA1 family)